MDVEGGSKRNDPSVQALGSSLTAQSRTWHSLVMPHVPSYKGGSKAF